jgi:hypothetical protein
MSSFASRARKVRLQFASESRDLIAELNVLATDPDLSAEAKTRRAEPVLSRLKDLAKQIQQRAAEVVAEARATFAASDPDAARRAEAFKKPERSAAIRALLLGASTAEIRALVAHAVHEKDLAAAYAIAQHIRSDAAQVPEKERAELIGALANVGGEEAAAARTDFLVARAEALRLSIDAAFVTHGGDAEPVAKARAAHEMVLVPEFEISISEDELIAQYGSLGLPIVPDQRPLALVTAAENLSADPTRRLSLGHAAANAA